jgi:hypothetical protein
VDKVEPLLESISLVVKFRQAFKQVRLILVVNTTKSKYQDSQKFLKITGKQASKPTPQIKAASMRMLCLRVSRFPPFNRQSSSQAVLAPMEVGDPSGTSIPVPNPPLNAALAGGAMPKLLPLHERISLRNFTLKHFAPHLDKANLPEPKPKLLSKTVCAPPHISH